MNKIKEYREAKGMTQDDLAKALGVSHVNIARYESGVRQPKLEQLKKIANVLECSYLDLIDDDDEIEHHVITYVKSKWNIDLEPLK